MIALVNKDASQDLTITIPAGEVIEVLSGPALDQSETHLTPTNASVKLIKAAEGQTLTIPAYTAVMLQLR